MYAYESLEEQVAHLSYWPSSMAPAETEMCGGKTSPCKGVGASMVSWSLSRSRASSTARGCSRNYATGGGDTRPKRPRSSPDRLMGRLHKRTPSPSSPSLPTSPVPTAPTTFHPMLVNNSSANVFNAVAFYSPNPPTTPMYLMYLPPYGVPPASAEPKKPTEQRKIQGMKKESMKIARHVTRSLLRAVEKAVTARAGSLDAAPSPPCDPVASMTNAKGSSSKAIASQTSQNIATIGRLADTDADDLSISSDQCEKAHSTSEWAGDVRALRDSHVRLVLRQLEQLRDIERLDRALRRARISSPLQRAPAAAERGDPSRTACGSAQST